MPGQSNHLSLPFTLSILIQETIDEHTEFGKITHQYSECPKSVKCRNQNFCVFRFWHVRISNIRALKIPINVSETEHLRFSTLKSLNVQNLSNLVRFS